MTPTQFPPLAVDNFTARKVDWSFKYWNTHLWKCFCFSGSVGHSVRLC